MTGAPLLAAVLAAAAAGGDADNATLASRFAQLPFLPTARPANKMEVGVGTYFEHLFNVDSKSHTFKADFWLVLSWQDTRNFSSLFVGNSLVELEETSCDVNEAHRRRGRRAQASEGGGGARRFLELGIQDKALLWQPDVHVRNIRQQDDDIIVHSEMIRLYEDGTVEHMSLTYGQLVCRECPVLAPRLSRRIPHNVPLVCDPRVHPPRSCKSPSTVTIHSTSRS